MQEGSCQDFTRANGRIRNRRHVRFSDLAARFVPRERRREKFRKRYEIPVAARYKVLS